MTPTTTRSSEDHDVVPARTGTPDGARRPHDRSAGPISAAGDPEHPREVTERPGSFAIGLGVGFVGAVACLVILGSLAEVVRRQELDALDAFASPFLHGLASPGLDAAMQSATFVGSSVALIAMFAIAESILIWLRRRRDALFLAIALAGGMALTGTMKLFFQRPRPQLPWAKVLPDYSFPSGHSMESLVFFVAIALIVWQARGRTTGIRALAIALAVALVVGVSRIYLGYHYLTDVLAGFTAGALWLLIVLAVFSGGRRWFGRRGSRPGP